MVSTYKYKIAGGGGGDDAWDGMGGNMCEKEKTSLMR